MHSSQLKSTAALGPFGVDTVSYILVIDLEDMRRLFFFFSFLKSSDAE